MLDYVSVNGLSHRDAYHRFVVGVAFGLVESLMHTTRSAAQCTVPVTLQQLNLQQLVQQSPASALWQRQVGFEERAWKH